MSNAPKMTEAEINALLAERAKLIAENEALKNKPAQKVTLKVSEKGAVSVYGMGRFPVTLYQEQWLKLLGEAENIKAFITLHQDELSTKAQSVAAKAVSESAAPAAPGKPLVPPTTVAQAPVKRYSSRG